MAEVRPIPGYDDYLWDGENVISIRNKKPKTLKWRKHTNPFSGKEIMLVTLVSGQVGYDYKRWNATANKIKKLFND